MTPKSEIGPKKSSTEVLHMSKRVSEFISMAQAIASHKPTITFPRTISNCLQDAIAVRREFADWYASNAEGENTTHQATSNDRHVYFIRILERTWEILSMNLPRTDISHSTSIEKSRPRAPNNTGSNVPNGNGSDWHQLMNRFSAFELEYLLETPADATVNLQVSEDTHSTRCATEVWLELEDADIEAEFWMGIHMYLKARKFWRVMVRMTWEEYLLGKENLHVAAMRTNFMAFFVRLSETSLAELVRPFKYQASKFPQNSPQSLYYLYCHRSSKYYDYDLANFETLGYPAKQHHAPH